MRKIKRIFNTFKNSLKGKFELKDFAMLIGAGLLFYGIWLIYPPAAYIVIGVGVIYLGVK